MVVGFKSFRFGPEIASSVLKALKDIQEKTLEGVAGEGECHFVSFNFLHSSLVFNEKEIWKDDIVVVFMLKFKISQLVVFTLSKEIECSLFLIEGDRRQIILAENMSKLYISIGCLKWVQFHNLVLGFFLKSYSPFYTHLDSFLSLESRPLNFRVFIHAYSLRPVVANTRTKSIQKQVKSIDVDKVGSKNHLPSKSVSFRGELIASSFLELIFKQARLNAVVSGFLFLLLTWVVFTLFGVT